MGFRRMAINLGMDKPFRPDKDVDFITSVIILSIFNLVIYVINQAAGIIIWVILALGIIGFVLEKIKKQDEVNFTTFVVVFSIVNFFVYVINQVVGIIIWILLALSIIGFLFKKIKKAKKGVIRISQRDDFA